MCRLHALVAIGTPAHLDPGLRRPGAALVAVLPDELGLGAGAAVAVADAGGERDGPGPEAGHVDGHRLVRHRVQAGVLHRVVRAVVRDLLAGPQRPHDLDGLLEHVAAQVDRGAAVTADVLVQVLAGADAKHAPAAGDRTGVE